MPTNLDKDFELYQQGTMSAEQETRERLAYKAEQLLKRGMKHEGARKHKWATGRQKWEALQEEGRKAAGVNADGTPRKVGRGRPRAEPRTELDDINDHLAKVISLQQILLGHGEQGLLTFFTIQVQDGARRLGDILPDEVREMTRLVLLQAANR